MNQLPPIQNLPVDNEHPRGGMLSKHDQFNYAEPVDTSDEPGGFDFWEAFHIIYNRKWMITAIVTIGLIAATVLSLRATPLYKAVATVEIQKQELQIIKGAGVDQPTIADAEYMSTQFELLQSRTLAERVTEQLGLPADSRYADQSLPRDQRLQQAANKIVKNLNISPAGRSRIINVEFVGPYPAETARITNAIIDNFIQSNLERRYNTTAYAREFLEERLATTKALLEDKERELVEYAERAGILDLDSGQNNSASLEVNSVIALNQALSLAESTRIEAEQIFLEASNNPDTRELVDNLVLRDLRVQLGQLIADYEQKLSIYQPQYPDMQRLQTNINAVRNQIAAETRSIISALEGDYRAALASEESLRERVRQLSSQLQDERDRRIQYTILQREVDTNRTQYEALLQRMKEISISSGIGSSQVSVIDNALVPEFPFQPNIVRSLAQALLLSLALGVGLAFALNYIDDTIKSPENLRDKLGIATLGLIPKYSNKKLTILDELNNPRSPIWEAYLSARTAIDYATHFGTPRSLLVTSTRPSEGKSSTVLALASAYANSDKRVLIIDADMRKPSFHSDPEDSIGLSGLLNTDEPVAPHIVETSVENVFLIPAGTIPMNPAEILSSYKLREIIRAMEETYEIVIVDSPPVLSFADAPLLGAVCQGAIVAIESGGVRTPAIKRTFARLYESRTNVLGAILTKFEAKQFGYAYSYYYSAYGELEDKTAQSVRRTIDKRSITIARKTPKSAIPIEESTQDAEEDSREGVA